MVVLAFFCAGVFLDAAFDDGFLALGEEGAFARGVGEDEFDAGTDCDGGDAFEDEAVGVCQARFREGW